MRERDIEKYLKSEIESLGGMCIKWTGQPGVPDRICLLPGGRVLFVEVKSPKGILRPIQRIMIDRINDLRCEALVVRSLEDVDILIGSLMV